MSLREQILKYVEDGNQEQLRQFLDTDIQTRLTAEDQFWLAFGQHALGRLDEAIRLLTSIETDEKGKMAICYQRAFYNIEAGNDADARADLEEVLRLSELTGVSYFGIPASLILADMLAADEPFLAAKLVKDVPVDEEIFLLDKILTKKSVEARIKHKLAE